MGQGTCCQFYLQVLPGNSGKQGDPLPSPETTPRQKWNQERVLVVDDEPDNRMVLKCALEPLGLSVDLASDGMEAVSRFSARRHQFVLMDLQMPVMDGYEAMRQIRLQPSGMDCRVIALTAGSIALCRPQAIAAGADACLAKPVQIDGLLEQMDALDGGKSPEYDSESEDHTRATLEAPDTEPFNVPLDLLSSIASAALAADYSQLLELFNEVHNVDASAAKRFRQKLAAFDYDAIVTDCGKVALAAGNSRPLDPTVQS